MCKIHIYFRANIILILTLNNLIIIKQNVRTKEAFEKHNYQPIMQS